MVSMIQNIVYNNNNNEEVETSTSPPYYTIIIGVEEKGHYIRNVILPAVKTVIGQSNKRKNLYGTQCYHNAIMLVNRLRELPILIFSSLLDQNPYRDRTSSTHSFQ
ncbi:hypothetical protein YC2023_120599 [Brassica napus]